LGEIVPSIEGKALGVVDQEAVGVFREEIDLEVVNRDHPRSELTVDFEAHRALHAVVESKTGLPVLGSCVVSARSLSTTKRRKHKHREGGEGEGKERDLALTTARAEYGSPVLLFDRPHARRR